MIELIAIIGLLSLQYMCDFFFDIVITVDVLDTAITTVIAAIVIIKLFYFQSKNFYLNVKKRMSWLCGLILLYTIICVIELYYFSSISIYTHNAVIHILYYIFCATMFFLYKREFITQYNIYGYRYIILNVIQCLLFLAILFIKSISKYYIYQYDIIINAICSLFVAIAFLEWYCSFRSDFWRCKLGFKKKIMLICISDTCNTKYIRNIFNTSIFLRNIENTLYYSYNRFLCLNSMSKYIEKSLLNRGFTRQDADIVSSYFKSLIYMKFMRRPSDKQIFVIPSFIKDKLYKLFNSKEKRGTYLRKTYY